jgi:hypothetical protein
MRRNRRSSGEQRECCALLTLEWPSHYALFRKGGSMRTVFSCSRNRIGLHAAIWSASFVFSYSAVAQHDPGSRTGHGRSTSNSPSTGDALSGLTSNHTLLAHSAGQKAQNVYAASEHEFGRDASQNPICVGQLLRLARDLQTLGVYTNTARRACVRFDLKAVSPHVCEHRHRNG